MGTISKMAEICKACPDRDKCDHKKMELCAYIDEPKATATVLIPNEINISINISGAIGTSDILKEIEKSISKSRYMHCGW